MSNRLRTRRQCRPVEDPLVLSLSHELLRHIFWWSPVPGLKPSGAVIDSSDPRSTCCFISSCRQLHELRDVPISGTCRALVQMQKKKFQFLSCTLSRDCSDGAVTMLAQNVQSLRALELLQAWRLTEISPLAKLRSLHTLTIRRGTEISDISALQNLTLLHTLNLLGMAINDVTALTNCKSLEALSLAGCKNIADLSPLEHCSLLRSLCLDSCTQISNLTPLTKCQNLEQLSLSQFQDARFTVDFWMPLTECHALRELDISCAVRLIDITFLAQCQSLEKLDISHCGCGAMGLLELAPLQHLASLRTVNMAYSSALDLTPLLHCTLLTHLIAMQAYGRCKLMSKAQCLEHYLTPRALLTLRELGVRVQLGPLQCSQDREMAAAHILPEMTALGKGW